MKKRKVILIIILKLKKMNKVFNQDIKYNRMLQIQRKNYLLIKLNKTKKINKLKYHNLICHLKKILTTYNNFNRC